jgi:hypothetical protein
LNKIGRRDGKWVGRFREVWDGGSSAATASQMLAGGAGFPHARCRKKAGTLASVPPADLPATEIDAAGFSARLFNHL